jgi:hypothetical protein
MKRRRPPPRWQPKPGHMLFYRQEVPIADVEERVKAGMAWFDKLPRKKRDQLNFVLPEDITPGSKRS